MAGRKSRKKKKGAPTGPPAAADDASASAAAVDSARAAELPPPLEQGYIEVDLSDEGLTEEQKRSGRRQARIPVSERVEVSGFFGVDKAQRVSDVSIGGVFVETPRVLEVGDPVVLGFPDKDGKIRVAGRVRWVTPFGGLKDARAGMGIELVGASDAERTRIFELLRGKRARG